MNYFFLKIVLTFLLLGLIKTKFIYDCLRATTSTYKSFIIWKKFEKIFKIMENGSYFFMKKFRWLYSLHT